MEKIRNLVLPAVVFLLLCLCVGIWYEVLITTKPHNLTVAFLNVGQGDAIYIESPTGTQIVVDGGPDKTLLRELSSVMSPFDRTIDALVVTNPDQDHFAGFINLVSRFQIGTEFEPGTKKTTVTYRAFESILAEATVPRVLAKRGMMLDIGGGAFLQILYPDRDVSNLNPNDGSIVMKLVYGKTSVMLMGDSTTLVESRVLSYVGDVTADILKLGHHGSKTSTGRSWVEAVRPQIAIVSASCDNSYGHPSKEVTNRLNEYNIPYLWTCKEGTIAFTSDGVAWRRK